MAKGTLAYGGIASTSDVIYIDASANQGIGTLTPVTKLTVEGALTLKEQADADSDTAAYGQIWVNTATPNELYFTDDAGTDFRINSHAASSNAAQVFNESGADVDFRVESDDDTHMIFVDGGNDKVGISTNAPASALHVEGTMQVGVNGTGHDVKFFSATTGKYFLWDETADKLIIQGLDDGGNIFQVQDGTSTLFEVQTNEIIFNETGRDTDFRVESDDNAHMLFVDGGNDRVGIGASAPGSALEVEQGSTGGDTAFTIDNNDTDQVAMRIEAANIDGDVLDIEADALTTSRAIDITVDALTTGSALYIDSDSSSTSARNIVEIINNNTAAVAAVALKVQQDSSGDAIVCQGGNIRVTTGGSAFQTSLHHSWVMGG